MSTSFYGFSPTSLVSGEHLDGPRVSSAEAHELCAKVLIAIVLYILTAEAPDQFLLGGDGTPQGQQRGDDVLDFALFSCGLARAAEDADIDPYSDGFRDRGAALLWDLYAANDFDWYESPAMPADIRSPALVGLAAFLYRPLPDGILSTGQTLDVSVLLDALHGFFEGQGSEPSTRLARDLRPYRDAFAAFRDAGGYALRI